MSGTIVTDQPPDRDGPRGPAKAPMSAAERMRARYWRGKVKKRSLRVILTQKYIDRIVRDGWIAAGQVSNPAILGTVVEDTYDCRKRGTLRHGTICATGTRT